MSEYIDIVDFARQILQMNRTIIDLERELEHKDELLKINEDSCERSSNHTKEILGIFLSATLDPDSRLNRGDRAIAELEIINKGETKQ